MRRNLNFVGGILGTVFSAIYTVVMFLASLTVFAVFGSLAEITGEGSAVIIAIVSSILILALFACAIVALIMNIKAIIASKDAETLKSKKRGVVTAIVFNFICAAYLIYTLFGVFSILNFLTALGLIAASVLMIVDLVQVKNVQAAPAVQTASVEPVKEAPAHEEFVDYNEEA